MHFPKTSSLFARARKSAIGLTSVVGLLAAAVPGASAEPANSIETLAAPAAYYGTTVDVAQADTEPYCVIDPQLSAPECFESEPEAEARATALLKSAAVAFQGCSSWVRLYAGPWGTGSWRQIHGSGGQSISLAGSPHNFNQQTSSYRIGGCNARFYDYTNCTSMYPTNLTQAGQVWLGMATGWNNDVSCIKIG